MSILPQIMRPALLAGATLGLSACMYADGAYGDGYVNGGYSDGYACDPYDPYDAYYSCDYGYGFTNIGFGGGWYDNYFYPGYGLFVFDRIGHRHKMRNHHRRYWAHRRHQHGKNYANRGHRGGDRAKRMRNLSPEQRAERRERRAERKEQRRDGGAVRNGAAMSQQDLQYRNRETRREMRRTNRQNGVARSNRTGNGTVARTRRPTMVAEQPQRARPAVRQQAPQRAAPRRAPAARAPVQRQRPATVRSSRHSPATSRRNVSDQ